MSIVARLVFAFCVGALAVLAVFLAWPILSFYQQADARITDAQYRERATATTFDV